MKQIGPSDIAHWIYFNGTKETSEGNYCFGFSEIAEKFDICEKRVEQYVDKIVKELLSHEGVLDVVVENNVIDVNFGTAYCGLDDPEEL